MKEIKFRAWVKEAKRMLYEVDIYHSGQVVASGGSGLKIPMLNGEDCELMQFTGIRDKYVSEIFEGDIVFEELRPGGKPGVVNFYEGIFWLQKSDNTTHDLRSCAFFDLKVIGNIFENPELVKL